MHARVITLSKTRCFCLMWSKMCLWFTGWAFVNKQMHIFYHTPHIIRRVCFHVQGTLGKIHPIWLKIVYSETKNIRYFFVFLKRYICKLWKFKNGISIICLKVEPYFQYSDQKEIWSKNIALPEMKLRNKEGGK